MLEDQTREENKAYDIGYEGGQAAGTWLVTEDNASTVLQALADCELDFPTPLNGEWAGESIPELTAEYGINLADEWIADSFECGYIDGYCEQVEREARAYVK